VGFFVRNTRNWPILKGVDVQGLLVSMTIARRFWAILCDETDMPLFSHLVASFVTPVDGHGPPALVANLDGDRSREG